MRARPTLQSLASPKGCSGTVSLKGLLAEPAEEAGDEGLAILLLDSLGERARHRAGADPVLRVAAVGDAVVTGDGREAVVARHLTRRVHVHQAHLRDGLRADVVAVAVLRAGFEAAAARHAARVGI